MSGKWATGGSNTAGAKVIKCALCGESFYWPNPSTETHRGYSTPVLGWECWYLFLRGYKWTDVVLIRKRERDEQTIAQRQRLNAPGLLPPGSVLPNNYTPADLLPPVKDGRPAGRRLPGNRPPVNDSRAVPSPCPAVPEQPKLALLPFDDDPNRNS